MDGVLRTKFHLSQKTFERLFFRKFPKKSNFIGLPAKLFRLVFSELISRCPEDKFEQDFFLLRISQMDKLFHNLSKHFLTDVFKTDFSTCLRKHILWKKVFERFQKSKLASHFERKFPEWC